MSRNSNLSAAKSGMAIGGYGVSLAEYLACLQLSQEYQKLVGENEMRISQGEWALGTNNGGKGFESNEAKQQVSEIIKRSKAEQPALDKMLNFLRGELVRHQTMIQSASESYHEAVKRQMENIKADMKKQMQQQEAAAASASKK